VNTSSPRKPKRLVVFTPSSKRTNLLPRLHPHANVYGSAKEQSDRTVSPEGVWIAFRVNRPSVLSTSRVTN
jgi:hypothetical protein